MQNQAKHDAQIGQILEIANKLEKVVAGLLDVTAISEEQAPVRRHDELSVRAGEPGEISDVCQARHQQSVGTVTPLARSVGTE